MTIALPTLTECNSDPQTDNIREKTAFIHRYQKEAQDKMEISADNSMLPTFPQTRWVHVSPASHTTPTEPTRRRVRQRVSLSQVLLQERYMRELSNVSVAYHLAKSISLESEQFVLVVSLELVCRHRHCASWIGKVSQRIISLCSSARAMRPFDAQCSGVLHCTGQSLTRTKKRRDSQTSRPTTGTTRARHDTYAVANYFHDDGSRYQR